MFTVKFRSRVARASAKRRPHQHVIGGYSERDVDFRLDFDSQSDSNILVF